MMALAKPSDKYVEMKVPEPPKKQGADAKKGYSPGKMRRFMRHLGVSSTKVEGQIRAKAEVRGRLEKIKSLALNKRSKKSDIEDEFTDFQQMVHDIIMDEQKILEEQRRETKEIQSLRSMVEDLSRKLVDLGREYAIEMEKKDKKILELRESLASARMKVSEQGQSRKDKIAEIEDKIKKKADVNKAEVRKVETDLKALEQTHAQLKRSGKHPPDQLDRLKKVIDSHKEKLKTLKK